ncbi:MAG: PAS domain-containing protein [Phycisphaerae bacterium]|nr:PAS domain-containing protein [Phycisphaerae bacterium]
MLGVRGKILGTSVFAVVIGIAAAAFLTGKMFEAEYTKSLRSEVSVIARNLRTQLDRIRSLGLDVDEIRGFEQQCQDLILEHPNLAYALVTHGDGTVLFHNDPAKQGKVLRQLSWLASAPGEQESIHLSKDEQGEEFCDVAVPSQPDDHGNVFIVVGFPSRLITDKVRELIIKSVLFGGVSLVLAAVLLLVTISASVTQPLAKLVGTIREIRSSGNLSQHVDVASKDEFGALATSFNEMVTSLRKARDELEDRVAERTEELSKANQELRQEIAERTRAEQALRESEERFRIIVERTGQVVYDYDIATGRIQWAGAIQEVTGYSPEEFAQVDIKGWEAFIHPEDRPGAMQSLEQGLRHGGNLLLPYRFRRKDGGYLHMEDSAVILRTSQGEAVRLLGTMKDITLRKMAEDELKHSHELLEQRVQERTLELVRANEQIRQAQTDLVQAEKMSMLGQLVAGVAHEINTPTGAIMNVATDAAGHLRELAAAAGNLSRLDKEVRRWLVEQVPEILAHGAAYAEVTDRQVRRQLEADLQRQGITDPRRVAEVLIDCGLTSSDARAVQCLSQEAGLTFLEHLVALRAGSEITRISVQKIAKIVKALRYYSRSGEGELFDINVNESLDNTLVILQNRIKHVTNIERCYAEGPVPVRCGGDISQVWTNILCNACDAIEEIDSKNRGQIRITTSRRDQQAVVEVFNTGQPIPPDTMPRIFDPFFTTKPIGKGTGLGLSICTGILRKYQGTITARNDTDGVTLEVTLPLSQTETPHAENPSPDAEAVAQGTS